MTENKGFALDIWPQSKTVICAVLLFSCWFYWNGNCSYTAEYGISFWRVTNL